MVAGPAFVCSGALNRVAAPVCARRSVVTGEDRRRTYARRRAVAATIGGCLLLALVAGLGGWRRPGPSPAPAEARVLAPLPETTVAGAADAAPAEPDAPAPDVWTVPERYRGQTIRHRVRHFPERLLALTFDDGPDPTVTPRVLAALAEHEARATFFVLGRQAQAHPELLQDIIDGGHALGQHSFSHRARYSAAQATDEFDRTAALVEQGAGRPSYLFRPPYGITDSALARLALERSCASVLWTISSADSRPIGSDVIARNVIYTPNPGDIVLMHDGPGHSATADAVPQILNDLSATGFRFVTLPELLQAWDRWLREQSQAG